MTTRASAGAPVRLAYDATADTVSLAHSGQPTTYTLELSSFDASGKPVSFTTPPAAVAKGDAGRSCPTWARSPSRPARCRRS